MVKKTPRNTCIILWVIFDTGLKFNLQISPVVSIKGFLQVRQAASQAEVNHVEARLEKKNTNSWLHSTTTCLDYCIDLDVPEWCFQTFYSNFLISPVLSSLLWLPVLWSGVVILKSCCRHVKTCVFLFHQYDWSAPDRQVSLWRLTSDRGFLAIFKAKNYALYLILQ